MRQGFIYLLRAGIGMLAFATAVAAEGLTAGGDALPDDAELEARGAHIGTVTVRVAPIFDTSAAGCYSSQATFTRVACSMRPSATCASNASFASRRSGPSPSMTAWSTLQC